jgi:phosphoglycerate dehydrogenase-like enzyme
VENDPFPRLLQAFLDAEDVPERTRATAEFVAHDIADYPAWLAHARSRADGLHPAEVRLASTQEELRAFIRDADAVVVESIVIGREELGLARRLRVVHKYGTVLNIDTEACAERGIAVLTVRRRANIACAEYAFGLEVVYFQRTRLAQAEEQAHRVTYRPLDQLLSESDWVLPLLPSNRETRGMIDRERVFRMKRGARLVNVARAELVERSALHEALAAGHLGGLGLDTFYEEPGRADDPLLAFDNAIITPRIAAQPRLNAFGDLEQVMTQLAQALGARAD